MKPMIYACFADMETARSAKDALVAAGCLPENITLVCKMARGVETQEHPESQGNIAAMGGAFPDLRAGGMGSQLGDDVAYGMRYSGIASTANASVDPGTMTDYLWETLPEDMAGLLRVEYDGGRAVLIVRDATHRFDEVLREQKPLMVHSHGYLA